MKGTIIGYGVEALCENKFNHACTIPCLQAIEIKYFHF